MHIVVVGLNHKTAPVEIREKVALGADDMAPVLAELKASPGVVEAALLSTCNRCEAYVAAPEYHPAVDSVLGLFARRGGILPDELRPHLYVHRNLDAVRHLFRVACGLDSMVLGETQVLGQVKEAYLSAADSQAAGKLVHGLFSQALAVGKRAHTETEISRNAVSVSYAAVELAKKVFESLEGKRVLIIGAGKMSELTARHLLASGVGQTIVANRTLEKARQMAAQYRGLGVAMEEVGRWLAQVDVVISSTGAPGLVLDREMVAEAMAKRRHRPIFLFDIAVPRDIDPAAGKLEGVFLYDIDDLENAVQANLRERQREAKKVERLIDEETRKFDTWLRSLGVVPLIKSLRRKADSICQAELQRAFHRLPELDERQRDVIEAMAVSVVNKMLNDPTLRLKEFANGENGDVYVDAVAQLFNLNPEAEEGR